jgi:hypothetical protein
VTVLLGALAGAASARNLSVSSQNFRATFTSIAISHEGGSIDCPVTLEGSLHARSFPKVAGSLLGYITRADLGPCRQGRATILRETLPWHIRYLSFSGRLPDIESLSVNIVGFSMAVSEGLINCLFASTAANPVVGRFERNIAARTITPLGLLGVVPTRCGLQALVAGTGAPVTQLNNTTRITLTLI